MKCFLVLCVVVALTNAEAPRFRSSRLRSRFLSRQEEAPADVDVDLSAPPVDDAPYPASGWRPDGPAFELPTEEVSTPDQAYGTPTEEVSSPDQAYGTPTEEVSIPDQAYGTPAKTYGTPVVPDEADAGVEMSARLRGFRSQRLIQKPNGFFIRLPESNVRRFNARPARIIQGNQQSRRFAAFRQ